MSVRISLTVEASEIFLSLNMIFSLKRAAVVWQILERISGFDPSLEMIVPLFLKFSASSSLSPFILICHSHPMPHASHMILSRKMLKTRASQSISNFGDVTYSGADVYVRFLY